MSLEALPAVAVIVTLPALTAVTTPFSSTVAIVSSLDLKDTAAPLGAVAVLSVAVSPTAITEAPETLIASFLTVIVAFKLVALPFLGVTLTQYPDGDNLLGM